MADDLIYDLGPWDTSLFDINWDPDAFSYEDGQEEFLEQLDTVMTLQEEYTAPGIGEKPKWGKIYADPRQVMVERRNLADRLARTKGLALAEGGLAAIQQGEAAYQTHSDPKLWSVQQRNKQEYRELRARKQEGLLSGTEEYKLSLLTQVHSPPLAEYTEGLIDERMKGSRHIIQAEAETAPIQIGGGGPKVERGRRAKGKQTFTKQGAQL